MLRDPSLASGVRKRPRRGGRTYSGCNICRLRKIKCDERQPTCSNCERSRRYICDGYERNENQDISGSRALMDLAAAAAEAGSSPQSLSAMENLADRLGHGSEASSTEETCIERLLHGFDSGTMFQTGTLNIDISDERPGCTGWSNSLAADKSVAEDTVLNTSHDNLLATGLNSLVGFQQDFGFVEGILPWSQQQVLLSRVSSPLDMCEQMVTDILDVPIMNPPPSSLADIPALQNLRKPQIPLTLSDPLNEAYEMSENARRLLDHYQTHVSQLMMPTSAPSNNPWLRFYLPIALQKPQTAAKKSLLFGLLAVAAFNKANLSGVDSTTYRRQASEFKERAANILKLISTSPSKYASHMNKVGEKYALLAAVLTMTTVEVFSGADEGKGYDNILLAKRIIQLTGGLEWWRSDPSGMTLLQIFRCLQIIAYTSGWVFPLESGAEESRDVVSDDGAVHRPVHDERETGHDTMVITPALSGQYTLDVSFGVSMKTLRCLNNIIELSKFKTHPTHGCEWPASHATELRRVEAELFDAFDDPDAFSGHHAGESANREGISDYVSEEIKENHIWAFHYSTAIFFRRAICDGAGSINLHTAPLEDPSSHVAKRVSGQALVSKAFEHLENVDALSSDIAIANTLWPGFIAAVEAVDMELRHRALIWFARAKRHGIGNIAKAKALVLEVWRRVDRQTWVSPDRKNMRGELSHVDWREVMREKGMFIMLT